MQPLLKFFRLSPRQQLHLLKTFVLLLGIRLGLWALSFKRLQTLLAHLGQPVIREHSTPRRPQGAAQVVWAVNVASHYMPGQVKCLARALTTQVLMQRRGYRPELRIGVAKTEAGDLDAHAWVEIEGQVVIGGLEDLGRYQPLPSL